MFNNLTKIISGAALIAAVSPVAAAFIQASASCPGDSSCDATVTDIYGFTFKIETTADATIFAATLTNTSPNVAPLTLIDLLAFNIDATLGTDFNIINVAPDWTFSVPNGGGVAFDYVGERDQPGDRIAPTFALTFEFDFLDGFVIPDAPFTIWTGAGSSAGSGIGGGGDSGQVAVSFQSLVGGAGSDLLTAIWTGPEDPEDPEDPTGETPEPGVLFLMGAGLLGLGMARRRKSA